MQKKELEKLQENLLLWYKKMDAKLYLGVIYKVKIVMKV